MNGIPNSRVRIWVWIDLILTCPPVLLARDLGNKPQPASDRGCCPPRRPPHTTHDSRQCGEGDVGRHSGKWAVSTCQNPIYEYTFLISAPRSLTHTPTMSSGRCNCGKFQFEAPAPQGVAACFCKVSQSHHAQAIKMIDSTLTYSLLPPCSAAFAQVDHYAR